MEPESRIPRLSLSHSLFSLCLSSTFILLFSLPFFFFFFLFSTNPPPLQTLSECVELTSTHVEERDIRLGLSLFFFFFTKILFPSLAEVRNYHHWIYHLQMGAGTFGP